MNLKKNHDIWISDLTHTEQGIVSRTFPLGASCVYSYAKKILGPTYPLNPSMDIKKLKKILKKF